MSGFLRRAGVGQQPAREPARGAYVGVFGTLAGTDPASAATLAAQLEPGGARKNVIGDIAESWARKSPQEALDWAPSLHGEERKAAVLHSLESWSQSQPAMAAAYLHDTGEEGRTGEVLKVVADSWVAKAPTEAATWVQSLDEGEGENQAMGSVVWN